MAAPKLNHAAIDRTIRRHWSKLRKKGVLAVRPGYAFTGGWITNQPAAVAIVDKKKKHVPPKDLLPTRIGDTAVDVQEAGPIERLRHTRPEEYARVAHGRPEYNVPAAPFERTMNKTGAAPDPVPLHAKAPRSGSKSPKKTPMKYTAPTPAPSLAAVTRKLTITCHASPDAGWLELQPFLSNVKKSLTVGMYDFTSDHILKAFLSGMRNKDLMMVLDHPSPNKTADQSDEQTRADILKAFKNPGPDFAWALEGMDKLVNAKIFPSAYHIKVAVRDTDTFWLSSGNWNNSNQPAIKPTANAAAAAAAAATAKNSDRDWHVIVEDAELAGVFEAFLKHDYAVAKPCQLQSPVPPTPLPPKKTAKNVEDALDKRVPPTTPSQYFKPQTITDTMTITPLLTPDNYGKNMLPLIQSAKKSLYIQTQYIHLAKKQSPSDLITLLTAVRDKMEAGVDVRIILSEWENPPSLDALKSFGINTSLVKLQNGVHNKGFVIDSSIVALGSQNWSVQGAQQNRDASLIIQHEGVAQYYEQIFMHDWTKMAVQHLKLG